MAIGAQITTWMETGIEQQIGICPIGTCPIPSVYAEIIGAPVMLAVAIGPVSAAQINARETSQASGVAQTLESYLREQLRHTALTEAMYPERILALSDFPTTSNGKLDKTALMRLVKQAHTHSSVIQPETPLEKEIFAVWQSILKDKTFGIHDSFTFAGGNSLTRNTLSLLLQERYKLQISHVELFTANTIAKQAALIDRCQDEELEKGIGSFPLATALLKGNIKMFEILLSKISDVNQRDARGRTLLYMAAYLGREDFIKLLLGKKAQVDIANHNGSTPLNCATRRQHTHLVEMLSRRMFSPATDDASSAMHVLSTTPHGVN